MTKNYKFETLQLHVGQENPDPATDLEQYRFIRQLLIYFTMQITPRLVLP